MDLAASAHFDAKRLTTETFVEGGDAILFFAHNRFLVDSFVDAANVFLPILGVRNRSAFQNQQVAFLGRRFDGGLDRNRSRAHIDFQTGVDGREQLGLGFHFDAGVDDGRPSFDFAEHLSDGARFQLGLDLVRFRRFHGEFQVAFEAPSDRRLDGDR